MLADYRQADLDDARRLVPDAGPKVQERVARALAARERKGADRSAREPASLRNAVERILQHLEQREANARELQVPGAVKCKECGWHQQHWCHDYSRKDYTDPENPSLKSHMFDPETLGDRVERLEAMSESHAHNIATLFRDVEALPRAARVQRESARLGHPDCYDVNGNPRCVHCGATECEHSYDCHLCTGFELRGAARGRAHVPGEPRCKVFTQDDPLLWFDSQVAFDEAARRRVAELDAGRAQLHRMQTAIDEHTSAALDAQGITLTAALDLDELQRLCDAATPGPWKLDTFGIEVLAAGDMRVLALQVGDEEATPESLAAARLAMAARTALPKLIDLVRKLEPIVDVVDRAPRCPKCHKSWLSAAKRSEARRCVSDAFGDGCGYEWWSETTNG